MRWALVVLAFIPVLLFSQSRKEKKIIAARQKADELATASFKEKFLHLLNDNNTASYYLASQFQAASIQPKGSNNYFQPLLLDKGRQIDSSTFLKINGERLSIKKDFFPLSYSASKKVSGMPAIALRERGVPWFLDIKDLLTENNAGPEVDIDKIIQKEALRVAAKGATALIIYNSENGSGDLKFDGKEKTQFSSIPVVYIKHNGYEKYLNDKSQMLDIELNVSLKEARYNVVNVAGSIDNSAASTIAITSFYNNSRKGESVSDVQKSKIEDNAAASAMLIELAKMLSASKDKNYNYLFIAFDAQNTNPEDKNNLPEITVASAPIRCIINVNNTIFYGDDKKILVEGYCDNFGTSEQIPSLAEQPLEVSCAGKKDVINTASIDQNNIPILSFSKVDSENTGSSSSTDKINFSRELQFTKFVYQLINEINTKSKISVKKG